MSVTQQIAEAIAQMEGFYQPGSIAQRQNNPGNLRSWGSYPVVNGYVQFPDVASGWQALYQQVDLNISRGLSLEEFFGGKPGVYPGYAPGSDSNDPAGYAQFVSSRTGIPSGVPLNALSIGLPSVFPAPAYDYYNPVSEPEQVVASMVGDVSPALLVAAALLAFGVWWFYSD